jgi:hypothetical protein
MRRRAGSSEAGDGETGRWRVPPWRSSADMAGRTQSMACFIVFHVLVVVKTGLPSPKAPVHLCVVASDMHPYA